MNLKADLGEMIRFSWKKSLEILLPFRFKSWFKILIIVWLAGVGIQGCSLGLNAPIFPAPKKKISIPSVEPLKINIPAQVQSQMEEVPAAQELVVVGEPGGTPQEDLGKSFVASPNDPKRILELQAAMEKSRKLKTDPKVVIPVAIGLGAVGFALALFFMWLSARFNFILLDAIVARGVVIGKSFKEHRGSGNSYFKWSVIFLGISIAVIFISGLGLIPVFKMAKWSLFLAVVIGILAAGFLLAVLLAVLSALVAVRDFVVPVMYKEKIRVVPAIRKLLGSDSFRKVEVFKYLLVILAFGILAGIVQGIVSIVAALAGMIAGGVMAVPGIILIKAVPFLKLPLLLIAVVLIVVLIISVLVVIGMVMLPVAIFFRVFALTFLTRLYPECDLLGFEKR